SGQRHFHPRSRAEVALARALREGIMDEGGVHEAVEPQAARRLPGGRRAQHAPTVEADARGRIAAKAVVERVEGETAEAIEIAAPERARFQARDRAPTEHERARQGERRLLVGARVRCGVARPPPRAPGLPSRRAAPYRRRPRAALPFEPEAQAV